MTWRKSKGTGALLALAILGAGCASEVADVELDPADEAIDRLMARSRELVLPGTALVLDVGGSVSRGAGGTADLETGEPLKPGHRFHIASVTKLFTTVAALGLSDRGLLDLDAGLLDVVDHEWVEALPYADEMTVRQLLDHSAGTYPTNNDPDYIRKWLGEEAGQAASWSARDFVQLAATREPRGRPGEGVFYSDTNTILLGLAIEAVAGESLRDHFRTTFFEPLELTSAGFFGEPDDDLGPSVRGYLYLSDEIAQIVDADRFEAVGERLLDTTSAGERIDAAAAIVMTARDLHRFAAAVFRGDLLSEESRGWLLSVGDGLGEEPVGSARQGAIRAIHGSEGVFFTAEGDGPGGVHSLVAYHPEVDLLVVGLVNSFGRGTESDFLVDEVVPTLVKAARDQLAASASS
jgi:CubicO group peptidase (beta-lactamase class C family)